MRPSSLSQIYGVAIFRIFIEKFYHIQACARIQAKEEFHKRHSLQPSICSLFFFFNTDSYLILSRDKKPSFSLSCKAKQWTPPLRSKVLYTSNSEQIASITCARVESDFLNSGGGPGFPKPYVLQNQLSIRSRSYIYFFYPNRGEIWKRGILFHPPNPSQLCRLNSESFLEKAFDRGKSHLINFRRRPFVSDFYSISGEIIGLDPTDISRNLLFLKLAKKFDSRSKGFVREGERERQREPFLVKRNRSSKFCLTAYNVFPDIAMISVECKSFDAKHRMNFFQFLGYFLRSCICYFTVNFLSVSFTSKKGRAYCQN